MDWIKKRTHVIDHPKFTAAGPIARDLYEWGMLWCGKHETDGEIPMHMVLSSAWGAGCKANIKPALKLVEVGLWERTDDGFRSLKWAEQGNETKGTISAKREAGRARKAAYDERRRNGVTPAVSNAKGSTSTSLSPSGYGSPDPIASTGDTVPAWFGGACDAAAMAIGGHVEDRPARWAEYMASRVRKGWAMEHTDAVGWLSTVVRSERSRAPAKSGKHLVQPSENRAWIMPTEMP